MRLRIIIGAAIVAFLAVYHETPAQTTRVPYNNQQIFLSGGNLAWMSFASDIGPGVVDYTAFADILLQIHNRGGNAVRWWLHTNGANTPQFNDTGLVVGPGPNTIANLRTALSLAREREIGMNLCLWSFDMLRATNSPTVVSRNLKLLTDSAYTSAYINNCLIPLVDSLKDNPGILAWEIFNEPEGMSDTWYFYAADQHVSMATIQRFVNLCAGAIHRVDSSARVTNGAWSFNSLTDIASFPASIRQQLGKTSIAQLEAMREEFNNRNRINLSSEEFGQYLRRVASGPTANYYRDDRLIAAGGDTLGTLDFYEVHYYSWGGTSLSPFHNTASTWGLTKPVVVAEFGITDFTNAFPSFGPKQLLYNVLYQNGYAGALAWSWTDVGFTTHADMLTAIQYMWDNHRSDVDVLGGAVDWPTVTITSPANGSAFPDSTNLTIHAIVVDTLAVDSVSFFVADTQWIGSVASPDSVVADTGYFTFRWLSIPAGQYTLKAVATNDSSHRGTSDLVQLSVGKPPMTRLEAEKATVQGDAGNISVGSSAAASGGAYLNIKTNDPNTTITWTFTNVAPAGLYYIAFGYRLEYQTPKYQYVNVNGTRTDTLGCTETSTTTWYERGFEVPLVVGQNTVQIQLSWGWMDLDYLAVPTNVLTSVPQSPHVPSTFALLQNYPNPFNPTTTISYALPREQRVRLRLYDLLGREVALLVDRRQSAGVYKIEFDASHFASGVYFYRLEAGSFVQTRRMLLLK